MMPFFSCILWLTSLSLASSPADTLATSQRMKQLKDYIRKEKPHFEERETQKRDTIEELDRLNAAQNIVRDRISSISMSHQELSMASENLSVELEKQKNLGLFEKRRLTLLLKVLYKIKKDGVIRFAFRGQNMAPLAGRIRVLYRTLRSHTLVTRQLEERAKHLADSERRLTLAKDEIHKLLVELNEQENILNDILNKKRRILESLNHKQLYFQEAVKEYKQISTRLTTLFNGFESLRDSSQQFFPKPASLPLPIEMGKIVKNFGRSIHHKFGTVTYHKGIEVEAEQNTPVLAVLPGTVEYDGWVKGLGNVMILHHGGGFYSLCAHLFKTLKHKGDTVQQGDTIGLVGDTGNNEKPSLYFEVRENGKAVNPLAYFAPEQLQKIL